MHKCHWILSLIRLKAALEKQYVIVFKQHPHIKEHIKIPKECADFVFDVSEKMEIDELCALPIYVLRIIPH